MPDELKVKNGLLVDASGSTIFAVDGSTGRLFLVNDSFSGSLFSVNTISGLPVIEAFSNNTIRMGQYSSLGFYLSSSAVGIGTESIPTSSKLIVSGGATIVSGALFAQKINGITAAPTLISGSGAGTAATFSSTGSDMGGRIEVNAGASTVANQTVVRATFRIPYDTPPYVLLTPANTQSLLLTGSVGVFVTSSTTGFTITSGPTAMAASRQYAWYYFVVD